MNMLRPAAAVLLVAILSGCAMTSSEDAAPTPGIEREYITGSHIPVRNPAPLTEEEKKARAAAAQQALQSMQATGAGIPKP